MKRAAGILFFTLTLTGCIATTPKKTNLAVPTAAQTSAFGHEVPLEAPVTSQQIVSSQYSGLHQHMAETPWRIARFRPNLNMPEFLDADMINDTLSEEKAANIQRELRKGNAALMAIPRLTLLPCDEGCVGNKDYEKMAKRFLSLYNEIGESSTAVYRGEIKVKVRWFRQKSFIERLNPLSLAQQVFAIEFPIEGNVLTLSSSSFGDKASLEDCVDNVAGKFKLGVIFPLALGLRNYYTQTLDPNYDPTLVVQVNSFIASPVRGLKAAFNHTDYSSRVEPITTAHQSLLPAVDGLLAGEGIDVGSGKLFDAF